MAERKMTRSLNQWKGKKITFYKMDGNKVEGVLIHPNDQFLMVKSNGTTNYYNLNSVVAIIKNTKDYQTEKMALIPFKTNLRDVMKDYVYKWVKVNCQQQLSFEGILSDVEDDYIILSSNELQVTVPFDKIQELIVDFQTTNDNQSEDNKENNQQNNQSHGEKREQKGKDKKEILHALLEMMGTAS